MSHPCEFVVPARVALAGNPSDGYGGRVVATTVPSMVATVRAEPATDFMIGDVAFADPDDLLGADLSEGSPVRAAAGLFVATLRTLLRDHHVQPCSLSWETTIPRSVGLAGSSALVIASLRAITQLNDLAIADEQLPLLAQQVEADELGIACGLQDRVVQTFGGTLSMGFPSERDYTYFSVEVTKPLELFVLWDTSAAEPSQVVHGDLRRRFEGGDPAVTAGMARLRDFANEATAALTSGDIEALEAAMRSSYERRAMMCDLSPSHVRLIDIADQAGCGANYTGSGGAVVGAISTDPEAGAIQRAALAANAAAAGLGFATWTIS